MCHQYLPPQDSKILGWCSAGPVLLMERRCLISLETNLDGLIDFSNFSGRGYLPLIKKDSTTHMHGLAVYVKEWLPFAWDLSLETSADTCLCFQLALLHSMS